MAAVRARAAAARADRPASAPTRCARSQAYPWPGNIRELRNVIYETLVYKRAGTEILLVRSAARILKRGGDAVAGAGVDRGAVVRARSSAGR